jgi:hypothetical protein
VPIRSPEAITGKLQFLADNRDILEKMSTRAETPGHELRTWEMTGRNLVDTLRDFVEMPKR